ncbi:MAG: two-component system, OmpR family, sensor kinase [Actinomycetota bacterium]|nr:two-component system, OmpR family, sensor kinase [Actinomycetota bacterium]
MLAATVAVVIAGAVSVGLIRGAAQSNGRTVLKQYANLATAAAAGTNSARAQVPQRVATLLRALQVRLAVVQPDGRITGAAGVANADGLVTSADAAQILSGAQLSTRRVIGGVAYFVEGRPIADGGGAGGGVVLVQQVAVARSAEKQIGGRLLVALIAGLVGAAVAGVLLARRLARPLQHAAAAARRLSTGARDVRLMPEGPAEVAEVADALNGLTAALAVSEGRQREFLLSISHELRTPLTAVKGYAEAMADGVVPADAVAATGQVLVAESSRLERLVSDLLDLARLGAQDFRLDTARIDLVELVRQAALVWSDRCAREGVAFSAQLPDSPLVVDSDPTRVRQILDGLAENALRVTPAGRPIVFRLAATPTEAVLQVHDGGPGLTEDDCRVAFDRSALYDRYRGVRRVGTGVGLALVAGLAGRLGGRAEAGRSPEGGACFTIRLPRT